MSEYHWRFFITVVAFAAFFLSVMAYWKASK